jgi:hypothetical protein
VGTICAKSQAVERGRGPFAIDIMNHELTLSLELLAQAPERLDFGLRFQNLSAVKLLLPYPEIHGLRFVNTRSQLEAEWSTCILLSSEWGGFTIAPGESKIIEYRVRPSSTKMTDTEVFDDYHRWSVDLPAGEYLAWFTFRVGEDYFCPDSHYEINELRREAEKSNAVVWMGEVNSNRIHVTHVGSEPEA